MKKVIFTAIAMIAFSGASMANTKEVKKEAIKTTKEVVPALPVGCATRINALMDLGYSMHDACNMVKC
ncbi:MAG: hypothetical protein RL494_1569 [Bacteroidota bacterium]|jgi:hypothetical protein